MALGKRLLRAVQYVRMSTEHQRYSLDNQAAVIADYALAHGYQIWKTYSDAGKSGLHLKGRKGLQELLSDALSPARPFDTILVLDVSRWGRFQDPDQSAYYEYLVREAGVKVVYCAEPFDNDGAMVSTIVKHLKRVMAAEYSRELSAKVTRAKLQQAKLGFRQGGSVPYGFRRQLVEESGKSKRILEPGELKWLHTDRVLTVAGPAEEQAVIRRMFKLFVRKDGSFAAVARQLNAEGIEPSKGGLWRAKRVAYIIRNELCVGTYVYNRSNRLMRQGAESRPPSEWVRVRVGPPIVSPALFAKASRLANGQRHRWSDAEMLRRLKRLLKRKGHLTPDIIDAARDTPTYNTYVSRFGRIADAYDAIGYTHHGRHHWKPQIGGWWTDDAILDAVRELHAAKGHVSRELLASTPGMPSPTLIASRFGGLMPCYAAAGLPSTLGDLVRSAMCRSPHFNPKMSIDTAKA